MNRTTITFVSVLTFSLLVVFGLHLLILHLNDFSIFSNKIIPSYLFNYTLAILTFVGLFIFKDKLSSSLGFVFMGGSMFKFALFFLLFYPIYNADGEVSRQEFASFFIPYSISLTIEVVCLVKTLNN